MKRRNDNMKALARIAKDVRRIIDETPPCDNQPDVIPPDPEELNNSRAEWAQEALAVFMMRTGVDEWDSAVGDLIADLRHLSDRLGVDWDDAVRIADMHYTAETTTNNETNDDEPTNSKTPIW